MNSGGSRWLSAINGVRVRNGPLKRGRRELNSDPGYSVRIDRGRARYRELNSGPGVSDRSGRESRSRSELSAGPRLSARSVRSRAVKQRRNGNNRNHGSRPNNGLSLNRASKTANSARLRTVPGARSRRRITVRFNVGGEWRVAIIEI